MTTGPINPVEAVAAAKRVGLISEGDAVKLPDSAFKPNHCAESNRVFLWDVCDVPPFMRAKKGWRIVGYGKAPWPKVDWPLAVMFERIAPPSCPYGNVDGDEMKEGTRIWQHGREDWIPGLPAYERRKKAESFSVKLPEEAGIARIQPTPKPTPRKLLKRAKREAGNRKWIITKRQRPDLFP